MSRYIRGGAIDGVACDEDELDGGERGGVFVEEKFGEQNFRV